MKKILLPMVLGVTLVAANAEANDVGLLCKIKSFFGFDSCMQANEVVEVDVIEVPAMDTATQEGQTDAAPAADAATDEAKTQEPAAKDDHADKHETKKEEPAADVKDTTDEDTKATDSSETKPEEAANDDSNSE